ncbi:P-loop containing nucleoside triphosphate hydrolase protein [Trichocladium antarcticum]|uniref:P-loop containing nucleoside triphosphate hydrolase protein n=1 Tax=Trichocladium antarcticum TaxID=1450529 RepID=A0AAN6ULR3_9PEZI|nr:P-loop containing nucleoside triphosphate hydrolase protein [Trichocladium antarcticum]
MTATGSSPASCAEPNTKEAPGSDTDIEKFAAAEAHLRNTTVHNISWQGVTVTVKDRETGLPKTLVDNVHGLVKAGEICALMGPSGSGKTTLLNYLASRPTHARSATGSVHLDGAPPPSRAAFRALSCFVEQEDALLGALTVRETLSFSARLSSSTGAGLVGSRGKREVEARIDGLLDAFGLREQADALVGTPLRKGISGGQKRRLGVASQLITSPKVMFLDEPTSGLDSAAGWEVVSFLRGVAKRNNLIVIASIHQPSTSTFNLFDKLLLMSHGKTHYFGPVSAVTPHYESLGHRMPLQVNPAEFLLELVNTDFAVRRESAVQHLDEMQLAWTGSSTAMELTAALAAADGNSSGGIEPDAAGKKPSFLSLVLTLLHRSFVKSYRDVVVYAIRLAMYTGLAIMAGTVWLRLSATQSSIQPFINSIFYGSAFMSFMAVAYTPAYIEDYMQYIKEKRNGLYGATAMMVSNFLVGIPYLFIFALVFSSISYWLTNFQPTAQAFFTWVLWVFLDLLAAESLVVLLSSLFPSFVIALALIAFANGLWMCVNGFMVPPDELNVFYKYVFHYWDYQKYVFENMMVNEFSERVYTCATTVTGCQCMWQTDLADQCLIRGQGILDEYGYQPGYMGKDVGIMMGIVFGYRLVAWIVLKLKE